MKRTMVTVVIPNYNGLRFMEDCFAALDLQVYRHFKVLVVDNGSTDGSVEWLKERGVPTIFLEKNTGFSGAVNVGIKAADTPYVILLNNDTEPEPDYVGELVRAIGRSERIFSVSPKMVQMFNRELWQLVAAYPKKSGLSRSAREFLRVLGDCLADHSA